jgi:trans-aconitate 2-methyltransferase
MDKWNPELYLKYADERTQPSLDLISRIKVENPTHILDIGCGPGNSTQALRDRWPDASITGLDNSPEMIEKARSTYPQGSWVLADAAQWVPDTRYNIVFSNAVLQWLPNHESLLKKLFAGVKSQGALAVQVPANNNSPLHQAVLRVSAKIDWKQTLEGCDARLTYHDASFFYDQLSVLSRRVFIWYTIYYHGMRNHQGLIDWYASTGMRPYLERLANDEQRRVFQSQVLEECRFAYPEQRDGRILFPFQRLFFVAYQE